mgnify:CR=1 FL=1
MRTQISGNQITNGVNALMGKLNYRLNQKGSGTFSSKHEILGVIAEEYKELLDAVHSKDYNNMKEELLDIAVGSLFGYICLEEKTVEW